MQKHVFSNGVDWIIASTKEEATKLWLSFYGYETSKTAIDDGYEGFDNWYQIKEWHLLKIKDEDTEEVQEKTPSEWIEYETKHGNVTGILGSSEW